nr:histidine kinase [Brevibacillus composti]
MEAAYLQAQIHPHFLFNTLNAIIALGDIDTEKMKQLADAFASYLRISFDFLNAEELVSLSHELALVEAYLFIEKERFGERLTVVWKVDPQIDLTLPPLTIQPLIEVRDNGIGMEEKKVHALLDLSVKDRSGIGVPNTNRRLTQMYGKGLSIYSQPGEGTIVSFRIPVAVQKRASLGKMD